MDNSIAVKSRSEINRQNGLLGGVKTPQGKAISKQNATKHGLLVEAMSGYEKELCSKQVKELYAQLRPVGAIERLLVERIAIIQVRICRCVKAEGEFMQKELNPKQEIVVEGSLRLIPLEKTVVLSPGYNPVIGPEAVEQLNNVYNRYEASLENRLYKALHELERIQKMRLGMKVSDPLMVDVTNYGREIGSFRENS